MSPEFQLLDRSPTDWLRRPDDERGLHTASPDGDGWEFTSYRRLGELAQDAAAALAGRGVGPGDRVLIVVADPVRFAAHYFGTVLLGASPAPAAPPPAFTRPDAYAQHVNALIELIGATAVAADPEVEPFLARRAREPVRGPAAERAELIQFSSGSTGAQRAVLLGLDALWANVTALVRWLKVEPPDAFGSWLPLYHDMGLVGMLLGPMTVGCDIWLIRPHEFVRSPARWVRLLAERRCAITAIPPFGLAHVRRRVRDLDLGEADLSNLRAVIVGAERIDAATARGFSELLARYGLRETAVLPAYGMAEATLAVTGTPLGSAWRTSADGTVSCGRPLESVEVHVLDEDGRPVPDGSVGEIHVSGPSLAHARLARGESGPAAIGPRLRTGDAGFFEGGDLFVLGRIGDAVKHLGRWVFADDVQELVAPALPARRTAVALLGAVHGRERAVIAVEGALAEQEAEAVGRAVAGPLPWLDLRVARVGSGWIERTTSGKPRRRVMWAKALADEFEQTVLYHAEGIGRPEPGRAGEGD